MRLFAIIPLIFILWSCSNPTNKRTEFKTFFGIAMENQSTSPDYIVIKVIDLNTFEKKVICCESIDLSFALILDSTDVDFDSLRYDNSGYPIFELVSKKALEQLRFKTYNIEKVDSLSKHVTNDLIETILKEERENGYSKLLELKTTQFTENYFEHFLYRNGIFTHRDCESGYTVITNDK